MPKNKVAQFKKVVKIKHEEKLDQDVATGKSAELLFLKRPALKSYLNEMPAPEEAKAPVTGSFCTIL